MVEQGTWLRGPMHTQEDLFTFISMSSHKSSISQTRNTCSKPVTEGAISRISSAYNIMVWYGIISSKTHYNYTDNM